MLLSLYSDLLLNRVLERKQMLTNFRYKFGQLLVPLVLIANFSSWSRWLRSYTCAGCKSGQEVKPLLVTTWTHWQRFQIWPWCQRVFGLSRQFLACFRIDMNWKAIFTLSQKLSIFLQKLSGQQCCYGCWQGFSVLWCTANWIVLQFGVGWWHGRLEGKVTRMWNPGAGRWKLFWPHSFQVAGVAPPPSPPVPSQ